MSERARQTEIAARLKEIVRECSLRDPKVTASEIARLVTALGQETKNPDLKASRDYLGSVIHGRSKNPSAVTLGAIAQVTGYRPEWLLTGRGSRKGTPDSATRLLVPEDVDAGLLGAIQRNTSLLDPMVLIYLTTKMQLRRNELDPLTEHDWEQRVLAEQSLFDKLGRDAYQRYRLSAIAEPTAEEKRAFVAEEEKSGNAPGPKGFRKK